MRRQAILFDLDGTLVPMDLDEFVQCYFKLLAKRFSQYDSRLFLTALKRGTHAMVDNDGTVSNEERFWKVFDETMGVSVRAQETEFDSFYRNEFHQVRAVTGENPLARQMIELAHERAEKVILATNPLFPQCGVESRLSWVGLRLSDFDYVTTFDGFGCCKPSAAYYQQICSTMGLEPSRCLMVGNDLKEDAWGASQIGMQTHVVTDCLIEHGLNLSDWSHSPFAELGAYL